MSKWVIISASALSVAARIVAGCNLASARDNSAPRLKVPEVVLTAEHAALCLVRVGDAVPEFQLPDLSGKSRKASELFGKRATVLAFFDGRQGMSYALLLDLGPDVVKPFAKQDVAVVAVAVGHTPDSARAVLAKAKLKVPTLVDAERKAFQLVAKKKLPRLYLLDAKGKVLWFDIEYSESTRRDLRQALHAILKRPKNATP